MFATSSMFLKRYIVHLVSWCKSTFQVTSVVWFVAKFQYFGRRANQWRREGGGNCPRAPGQGGRLLRPINKRLGLLNKGETMIPRLQSVNTANTAIGYLHCHRLRTSTRIAIKTARMRWGAGGGGGAIS